MEIVRLPALLNAPEVAKFRPPLKVKLPVRRVAGEIRQTISPILIDYSGLRTIQNNVRGICYDVRVIELQSAVHDVVEPPVSVPLAASKLRKELGGPVMSIVVRVHIELPLVVQSGGTGII